ncbi:MAG: thioredoxin domain-containing protein [Sphingomonas sp.]
MRVLAFVFVPLLMLAGCGGGDANSSAPAISTTPVAAAQPPAGKTWLDVVTATPDGNYIQGNPDAPIKLVEYGSRSCPVCGAFANTGVEPLRAKYVSTGRVSYEYRDFMVHNQDPGLALLGHCVPTEAFFTILDQMYAGQATFNARATQELFTQVSALPKVQQPAAWAQALGYVEFMKQRGVPEAKVRACLADTALLTRITDQMKKAADEKDVEGTPTFFVNDRKVDGVSFDQVEPALQAAGAR